MAGLRRRARRIKLLSALLVPATILIAAQDRLPLQQAIYDSYDHLEASVVSIGLLPRTKDQKPTIQVGLLIDKKGIVVTPFDTALEKSRILCSDILDAIYEGEIFRKDTASQIAMVRIKDFVFDPDRHRVAQFGDSDHLEIGQAAMVSAPLPGSRKPSLSFGIISTTNRAFVNRGKRRYSRKHTDREYGWIQTDATIGPYGHGCPLADTGGNIVGLCILIPELKNTDDLGFAIPINYVQSIVRKLYLLENADQSITRPQLGMTCREYRPSKKSHSKLPADEALTATDRGILVQRVTAGRAAEYAGIRTGDLITAIDDKPISVRHPDEMCRFRQRILALEPGPPVEIVFYRGKKRKVTSLTPLLPEEYAADYHDATLGLYLNEMTEARAKRLRLTDTDGILVAAVERRSPATKAKIRHGMRLLEVGKVKINSIADFKRILSEALEAEKTSLLLQVDAAAGKNRKRAMRAISLPDQNSEGQ